MYIREAQMVDLKLYESSTFYNAELLELSFNKMSLCDMSRRFALKNEIVWCARISTYVILAQLLVWTDPKEFIFWWILSITKIAASEQTPFHWSIIFPGYKMKIFYVLWDTKVFRLGAVS